jgi:hypothetical protein
MRRWSVVARREADSENIILRNNYETGEEFNTLPQVIDAGGQLPREWRNENGQLVERKRRRPRYKPATWNAERLEWKIGEEERAIQLHETGMTWKVISDMYGIPKQTLEHRIKRYKKLKKQLSETR